MENPMKRYAGLGLLMCMVICSVQAAVIETIEAVVNDEPIFSSEVDSYLRSRFSGEELAKLQGESLVKAQKEALRILIDNKLMLQAVHKQLSQEQLDAIRTDVENRTNDYMDQLKSQFSSPEQILREEQRQGTSLQQLREMQYQIFYDQYLQSVVIPQILRTRVQSPTDQEVAEFQKNNDIRVDRNNLQIAHVFLRVPEDATPEKEEEILYMAEQITKRARAGEPFETLVARFSQHEATKNRGGVMIIQRNGIIESFNPLFDMEEGDISDPIRSPTGYHVVKILRQTTPRDMLFQQKFEQETLKWLQELRQKGNIKIRQGSTLTEFSLP
jgi:peptidyl-prolyl cis-trans isomerase SurA